jgi:hypothetical protein
MTDPTSYADEQLAVLNRLADELLSVQPGEPCDGELAKEFVLRFRGLQATIGRGGIPTAWQPVEENPDTEWIPNDTHTIAEERADLTADERAVVDALTDTPQTAETIAREIGMSVFAVRGILDVVHMAGIATDDSDWRNGAPPAYRRRPQSPFWTEARA